MAFALPILLAAAIDPRISPLLDRVSEEARAFAERSPKYLGVEKLTQRGRIAPPRFRLRNGVSAQEAPTVSYRTVEVVSEYAFGHPPEAPDELREVRVVTSVNGRPVRERLKARLELAENMSSDLDRLTKQMLQDTEAYGLVGAVSDVGQMLMLFQRPRLGDFEFEMLPDTVLGGEAVAVLAYRQKKGEGARVYHRQLTHVPLSGELWVRRDSGLPARITASMPLKEGKYAVVHSASVDYKSSPQGILLPVRTTYTRRQDSLLMVDTEATYSDFKMFSADAEIKFLAEGEPEQ